MLSATLYLVYLVVLCAVFNYLVVAIKVPCSVFNYLVVAIKVPCSSLQRFQAFCRFNSTFVVPSSVFN